MAAPMQDCAVLCGDSITNRQDVPRSFQSLMCENYRRHLDIINRGFGGYNTTFARAIFDQIFAKKGSQSNQRIRLVTIWYGANDAVSPGEHGEQHVDVSTYRANLEFFLESLTSPSSSYDAAHHPLTIILITPPPISVETLGDFGGAIRKPENIKKYVDVVNDLAAQWRKKGEESSGKWKVEGIDMWSAVLDSAGGDKKVLADHFSDGLHLNTKGYSVLWQEYIKLVKGPLKGRGLDPEIMEDCPPRVPLWENVDKNRPESVAEGMKHAPFRSS